MSFIMVTLLEEKAIKNHSQNLYSYILNIFFLPKKMQYFLYINEIDGVPIYMTVIEFRPSVPIL